MTIQSEDDEGSTPSPLPISRLLTMLPVEIRLQIYEQVFRGSRVRFRSIIQPYTPGRKTHTLRPSHHHQLLLVCRQIYTEALRAYWSSTIIVSGLYPPLDEASFAEILRTIPEFAQPLIKEVRFTGFRETSSLKINQFVGRFTSIETLVMEPASFFISPRFYRNSTWADDMIISREQCDLRMRFPRFGLGGPNNIQVLQKVRFPVIARSSNGLQIRLSARSKKYPAKVFFVNHSKLLVAEGDMDILDAVGFQKVL